jgi:regulatory protein
LKGSQNKARQYALKLLSYRGRSEKEMEERLIKKGIPGTEASSEIEYLKHAGLIDDKSLAEILKREALTTKMLSRNGARRFILNRGIPVNIADMVFSENENTDIDNATRLADKKFRVLKNYPPETARRRLYALLSRKGYSSDTIMTIFKKINFTKED